MSSPAIEFKILVFSLSTLWGLWETRGGMRDRHISAGTKSDRGSFLGLYLAISVGNLAATFLSFKGVAPLSHHWTFAFVGLTLMVGAFLFRWRSMRVLARYFTHRLTIQEDHRLITSGPYRWIRHPSYLGILLLMLGIGLALTDAWSIAIATLPVLAAVSYRIALEERALVDHFGEEYARYCTRTRRLIPFVW